MSCRLGISELALEGSPATICQALDTSVDTCRFAVRGSFAVSNGKSILHDEYAKQQKQWTSSNTSHCLEPTGCRIKQEEDQELTSSHANATWSTNGSIRRHLPTITHKITQNTCLRVAQRGEIKLHLSPDQTSHKGSQEEKGQIPSTLHQFHVGLDIGNEVACV